MSMRTAERAESAAPFDVVSVRALRDWLSGDWGLVFSHPDDFAPRDIEADRWCVVAGETLEAAGMRALGIARNVHDGRWLADLQGRGAALHLKSSGSRARVVSFLQHALAHTIARTHGRCVLMIDGDLRVRRTYVYSTRSAALSLLDLIEVAASARSGQHRARHESQERSVASSAASFSAWERNSAAAVASQCAARSMGPT